MIPFLGLSPDLDPTTPGVITAASQIIPTLKGMAGAPTNVDVGVDALAAASIGAGSLIKLDGSNRVFAGTQTKMYERSSTTWADVSRAGAYTAGASDRWRFAQFGNTSLAVNGADVIQSTSSGAFADLTAPKPACIAAVNGFVMVADTNDATYGDSPDRWWCSAINDPTDWVPSTTTQCTTGRLVDSPGNIRGLRALGGDIVAYKARSMYIGRYVGAPSVWSWFLIPGDIGCAAQEGVVNIGTAHVFVGFEDFYIFDGTRPVPIGAPLKEWFFTESLDNAYREKIIGLHDRANALVWFFYPTLAGGGAIDGCVVYNYKTNKWGAADRTLETGLEYIGAAVTINGMDAFGAVIDDIDMAVFDSPFWLAAREMPAIIGTDHKLYSLTGVCGESSYTTGDFGDDQQTTTLQRVRLRYLTGPTSAAVTNYTTEILGYDRVIGSTTTQNNGSFDFLAESRWHRLDFDFSGDHEETGLIVTAVPGGTE